MYQQSVCQHDACVAPGVAAGTTVADAMLRFPKLGGPATTVAQARDLLRDDHVHAVLVVRDGVLLTVVERGDVAGGRPGDLALLRGRLRGRVVGPGADLRHTMRAMIARERRRLAVVDEHGTLLGLLCLKRSGRGFCADAGVAARHCEQLRCEQH